MGKDEEERRKGGMGRKSIGKERRGERRGVEYWKEEGRV